jgi:hypothetical protein
MSKRTAPLVFTEGRFLFGDFERDSAPKPLPDSATCAKIQTPYRPIESE